MPTRYCTSCIGCQSSSESHTSWQFWRTNSEHVHSGLFERPNHGAYLQSNFTFIWHPAADPTVHQDRHFQACCQILSTVSLELAVTNSCHQRLCLLSNLDLGLELEGSPTFSNTLWWSSWESRHIQVIWRTCIERFEVGAAYSSDLGKRCVKTVLLEASETCWRWNWWLAVLLLLSDTSSSGVCLPSLAFQLDHCTVTGTRITSERGHEYYFSEKGLSYHLLWLALTHCRNDGKYWPSNFSEEPSCRSPPVFIFTRAT